MPNKEAAKRIRAYMKREDEEKKAAKAKAAEYRAKGIKQLLNAAGNLLMSEGHTDSDGVRRSQLSQTLTSLARYVEHGRYSEDENPFARATWDDLDELIKQISSDIRIH